MTAFLFASVILFIVLGIPSVVEKTTSIMAIVPSNDEYHSVVFQVCADDIIMRSPAVTIFSDLEIKQVRLSQEIKPNTCMQTAALVKASHSSTISLVKQDKSELNKKVTEAENKIIHIRSEIFEINSQIKNTIDSSSHNEKEQTIINQKINGLTMQLASLRKELQEAKNEYDSRLLELK